MRSLDPSALLPSVARKCISPGELNWFDPINLRAKLIVIVRAVDGLDKEVIKR
jgi:hypothetical protein